MPSPALKRLSGNRTPLMAAIQDENYSRAMDILARNPQLMEQDDVGHSALHYVAKKVMQDPACLPLFEALITASPDAPINQRNRYGATPLLMLCQHAQYFDLWSHCLRRLVLEKGATMTTDDLEGNTPLAFVMHLCDARFVELLLDLGASPALPSPGVDKPIEVDMALFEVLNRNHSPQVRQGALAVLGLLLVGGAQPSEAGFAYLQHNAVETRSAAVVLLVQAGLRHRVLSSLLADQIDHATPSRPTASTPRL